MRKKYNTMEARSQKLIELNDLVEILKNAETEDEKERLFLKLIDKCFQFYNFISIRRYGGYITSIGINFRARLYGPPDKIIEIQDMICKNFKIRGHVYNNENTCYLSFEAVGLIKLLEYCKYPNFELLKNVKKYCKTFLFTTISDREIEILINKFLKQGSILY